jgi:hypothetical protein
MALEPTRAPSRWDFETLPGLKLSGREKEHQVTRASLEDDIKM